MRVLGSVTRIARGGHVRCGGLIAVRGMLVVGRQKDGLDEN